MTKRLKYLSYEERLQELGLCSPENSEVGVGLINAYKYLKVRCQGDGVSSSCGLKISLMQILTKYAMYINKCLH